ncbi:MAG TPA: TolC family protein, partial [Pyrinomonadaceae bacterium]|nr:TolC family protein [Pyrinomonadaceae bacterium]
MDVSVNCGGNGPPRFMIRAAHGALIVIALFVLGALPMAAQKKKTAKAKPAPAKPIDELTSLREEFIKATNDYKASLEKLLASYEKNTAKAETRLSQTRELFAQGLVSKNDVEASERTLAEANDKVAETRQRMNSADAQIADTLLEAEAEKSLSKAGPMAKGSMLKTSAYIRYNGSAPWALSDAWKVQRFFLDTFKKPLPIAVFGQGAVHDRWRLDHHNAMDVSLHPDGAEGQA